MHRYLYNRGAIPGTQRVSGNRSDDALSPMRRIRYRHPCLDRCPFDGQLSPKPWIWTRSLELAHGLLASWRDLLANVEDFFFFFFFFAVVSFTSFVLTPHQYQPDLSSIRKAPCPPHDMPTLTTVAEVAALLFLLNYALSLASYHRARKLASHSAGQVPPAFPFFFPHVEPLISLIWNPAALLRRVT